MILQQTSLAKLIGGAAILAFVCVAANAQSTLITRSAFSSEIWPKGFQRVRNNAPATMNLIEQGQPSADIVLLNDNELLRNAADWIADSTHGASGATLPIGGRERLPTGLIFFADLFQNLGSVAVDLEEIRTLAKTAGKITAERKSLLSLNELENILAESGDFPQKTALRELATRLRRHDVVALRRSYIDSVYGIYNSGVPSPADPRNGDAVNNLFSRFNCDLAKRNGG
jgi:hypothetical protein